MGTTGTGKTQLSLSCAQKLSSAAIVNADSVQVYKGLDIGTAKPDKSVRSSYPHFLFDHVEFPNEYNVASFYKESLNILSKNYAIFIFTGGSGFYFSALENGMYPHAETPKEITQKYIQLEQEQGLDFLFQELCRKDAQYSSKIKKQDKYRIVRSLALMESSGQTISSLQEKFQKNKTSFPYPLFKIGLFLTKEELKKRIIERVNFMIQSGLVEEVKSLAYKGHKNWKPLNSVGYKEVKMFIQDEITLDRAQELIVKNTLDLAKRQSTWFKKDPSIRWFHSVNDEYKVKQYISEII